MRAVATRNNFDERKKGNDIEDYPWLNATVARVHDTFFLTLLLNG